MEDFDLDKEFAIHCENKNSCYTVSAQLPILKDYASKVDHITEIGVAIGNSARGFLAGRPKRMVGIDIKDWGKDTQRIKDLASNNGIDYKYIIANSLSIQIEPTDLLFLDGNHSYDHVLQELIQHSPNVSKWIFLHDINAEGQMSPVGKPYAVLKATNDFLKISNKWKIKLKDERQAGLMILERIKEK